jgi:hypothetical protein
MKPAYEQIYAELDGHGPEYLLFHDTLHPSYPHIKEIINRYVDEGRFTIIKEYTSGCGKTLVRVNDAD